MGRGDITADLRRLQTCFDGVAALVAAPQGGYGLRDYAFNEIGRTVCSIIDRVVYVRTSEPPDVLLTLALDEGQTRRAAHARCTGQYVDMGFEQLNVCLHLQRWVHGTSLPTATELAVRGWNAVRSFDPAFMLRHWSLIDLYMDCPEDASEAGRQLTLHRPDFDEAHVGVSGYAGLAGAPSPQSCPQETHYDRLFGYLCTLTEIAVSLMHQVIDQRKARERLGIITSLSDFEPPPLFSDDDDWPKSDAEAAALTRRQSGETLWDGLNENGRDRWIKATRETPLLPVGLHDGIERATFGHNARDSILALRADDPTICLDKRRAKLQDWFSKPSATVRYGHAFPVSAFRGIYNAVAFANRQGLVLNVRVGVSWYILPDCRANDCKNHFAQFKKNLVQWFAANGLKSPYPALVFVHERADRAETDRFHTHMMLAVPEALHEAFVGYVRKALLHVLRLDKLPSRVLWIRSRKITNYSPERRWPITRDQWTTVTYMLKGVDPAAELGLNVNSNVITVGVITHWRYEDPGNPFAGEPWGGTETIGPGKQKAFRDGSGHAFHSLLDWQIANEALDYRDLYTDYYLDQAAGRRGPEPPMRPSAGSRRAASMLKAAPFPDSAVLARLGSLLGGSGLAARSSAELPPASNPFNELLNQQPDDDKQ